MAGKGQRSGRKRDPGSSSNNKRTERIHRPPERQDDQPPQAVVRVIPSIGATFTKLGWRLLPRHDRLASAAEVHEGVVLRAGKMLQRTYGIHHPWAGSAAQVDAEPELL
jgi:hypothetical protein